MNDIFLCNNLIDILLFSIFIWYIVFLVVFGNFFGLFYRGFNLKFRSFFFFVIYFINLSIVDFLMGVYMFIIVGVNLRFSGCYGFEDEGWRYSYICIVVGVLVIFLSEVFVLFVFLIIIDRIIII